MFLCGGVSGEGQRRSPSSHPVLEYKIRTPPAPIDWFSPLIWTQTSQEPLLWELFFILLGLRPNYAKQHTQSWWPLHQSKAHNSPEQGQSRPDMGNVLLTLLSYNTLRVHPALGAAMLRPRRSSSASVGAGRRQSASMAWPVSERVAVMREQALLGNSITACKVPLRAPGESQTRDQPEARG